MQNPDGQSSEATNKSGPSCSKLTMLLVKGFLKISNVNI